MKEFEDLTNVVNLVEDRSVSKKVSRYICIMIVLKFLLIFFLTLLMQSILFNTSKHLRFLVILFGYVLIFSYIIRKHLMASWVKKPLISDCNGTLTLLRYTALAKRNTRKKSWGLHFFNISNTLYYEGRFDDAKAVVSLMESYACSNLDNIMIEIMKCKFAFHDKDIHLLKLHSAKIELLKKDISVRQFLKLFKSASMHQPILLELERNGEYQELYEHYKNVKPHPLTRFSKVQLNYYLFCAAASMGDIETAKAHQDFVLTYGGTLWYKKAIEDEIEKKDLA